jgi:hypothetical protein
MTDAANMKNDKQNKPPWDDSFPKRQSDPRPYSGLLLRRNGRQMILSQGSEEGKPKRQTNGTLVATLAKAYRWQEELESGQYASLEDLAQAKSVDRTYAGRILRLTSLTPEIVEAILAGDEPGGLSLGQLQKELPFRWDQQHEMWHRR